MVIPLLMLMSGLFRDSIGYESKISLRSLNLTGQEIPFENLTSRGTFFESKGIQWYESILFDYVKDQIILGAKSALLRLDPRLKLLERHDIPVPSDRVQKCKSNSHTEEDCQNYIPVLHVFDVSTTESVVYACGTYSFDPMCFVRDIENLSNPQKMKDFSGENKAPQNPRYKGDCASWLNAKPDKNLLFLGTYFDMEVHNSNIAVSEMSDAPTFKPKKVGGSLKLQNAEFADTFQMDEFVYFVFRENSIEKPANGISSRIGRVCADGDVGIPDSLSFTKVRLECGDFDSVQGISFLRNEYKLFATFSKQKAGVAKSAICQYNYRDIDIAFQGVFRCQKGPTSPWEVCPGRPVGPGVKKVKTCYGERNADDLLDRILMNATVLPECGGPVFETTEGNVLFNALAVQRSTSGYYSYKAYVGDDRSGRLWNINLGYCNQSEAYEIWEVTRPEDRKVSLEIVSVATAYDSVYVLTCCGLIRYPGLNFIPTTERNADVTDPSSSTTPPDDIPPGPPGPSPRTQPPGDRTTVETPGHSSIANPVTHPVMLTITAITSAIMILQRPY